MKESILNDKQKRKNKVESIRKQMFGGLIRPINTLDDDKDIVHENDSISPDHELIEEEEEEDDEENVQETKEENHVKHTTTSKLKLVCDFVKFWDLKPKLTNEIKVSKNLQNPLLIYVNALTGTEYELNIVNSNLNLPNSIQICKDIWKIIHDKDFNYLGIILDSSLSLEYSNYNYKFGKIIIKRSSSIGLENFQKMVEIFKEVANINVNVVKDYSSLLKLMGNLKHSVHSDENDLTNLSKDRLLGRTSFLNKRLSSIESRSKFFSKNNSSDNDLLKKKSLISSPYLHGRDDTVNKYGDISTQTFYGDTPEVRKRSISLEDDVLTDTSTQDLITRRPKRNKTYQKHSGDSPMEIEKTYDFGKDLKYQFNDKTIMNITNKDFQCLFNSDWVNDSIIDFFLKYYSEKYLSKDLNIYTFNTFFFPKLMNCKNQFDNIINDKWLNKNDCEIFTQNDYLVVPINSSCHWFGCIIENYNKVLLKKNRDTQEDPPMVEGQNAESCENNNDELEVVQDECDRITIYVHDSLRNSHSMDISFLKTFLIEFALKKFDIVIERKQIKFKNCQVPLQPNWNDCGIHLILNTKTFLEDPLRTIQLWNENSLRNSSSLSKDNTELNEYFQKHQRKIGRKLLRQVLMDLQFENLKKKNENSSKEDSAKDTGQKEGDETESQEDGEDLEIIEFPQEQPNTDPEQKPTEDPPANSIDKLISKLENEIENNVPLLSDKENQMKQGSDSNSTSEEINTFLESVSIKSSPIRKTHYPLDSSHSKKPSLKNREELINKYESPVFLNKNLSPVKVRTLRSSHIKQSPGLNNLSKYVISPQLALQDPGANTVDENIIDLDKNLSAESVVEETRDNQTDLLQ